MLTLFESHHCQTMMKKRIEMKGGILRGGVMVLVGWTTSRAASRFRSDVPSKAQAQLRTRVNVYFSLASMVEKHEEE